MAIKRVKRKKRPKRALGFLVLLISSVSISGFFYYQKQELQNKHDALVAEEKRLQILIDEEKRRANEIEDFRAYVQTKSYIEEQAREVLGLVSKNEVIFRVKTD